MKIGVVFPGQASQYIGMGKEILEENNKYEEILKIGERITNLPLIEKIFNGPIEDLTRTLFCQPSVFGISLVCWRYFKDKAGIIPSYLAGHSLGEYTALCAGEVFSIEEGFYLVKKRAEIMDEISQKVNGSLLAILGLSLNDVKGIIKNFNDIEISNINSYTQIIVGGKKDELEKLEKYLKEKRIKAVFLKVSGPFHTKYMVEASEILEKEIDKINFKNSKVPIYLNFSSEKTIDKEEIKNGLLKQLYSPVRWVEIIENMVKDGIECFVEIGPKNVLKKLIEVIVPGIPSFNIENPEGLKVFSSFLEGGKNV
ncbi:MAG TPA: ACP S-malonyltransferase [bacterium]|nr:ACP S-malonyltransferase [bacterium]HOM26829.1 ACP S-malonyltransferase [bacterium]